MTLDESIEGMTKLADNGVDFYVDSRLTEYMAGKGKINVEYVTAQGRSGYRLTVGDGCSPSACDGCG